MATRTGKLLTQNEKILCEKIVTLDIGLVSQRAQALLLLDDGSTQAKSCELSSLTIGQLRYLIRLFKKKGIHLFPQIEETKIEEAPVAAPELEPEPEVSSENVKKEKKEKKKKAKKSSTKKKKQNKKEGKNKATQSKEKKKKKGKKKKKKQ
jgi:hypothetical protein